MNEERDALYRDLYDPSGCTETRLAATRLIATAAVDRNRLMETVARDALTETLLAADVATHRDMIDAMLECIAIAEPTGYRTEAAALSLIRWALFRALRGAAEGLVADLIDERSPILADIGVELPPEDEDEMQTYDDRGEPVSIGRAP